MSHDRILELLAQGISPVQVVSIVGCQPAYLKSLLEDTEFASRVEAKQKEYFQEADEEAIISNKHLALEHKILKHLEAQLPTAEMRDTIRALEVISTRQEKMKSRLHKSSEFVGNKVVVNTINLTLPSHAIPEYSLSSNKEVVAIGDKVITPMSGEKVKQLFHNLKEATGEIVPV